jgi:hypothetical protein
MVEGRKQQSRASSLNADLLLQVMTMMLMAAAIPPYLK